MRPSTGVPGSGCVPRISTLLRGCRTAARDGMNPWDTPSRPIVTYSLSSIEPGGAAEGAAAM
jgi:hypothetical protein